MDHHAYKRYASILDIIDAIKTLEEYDVNPYTLLKTALDASPDTESLLAYFEDYASKVE